MTVPMVPLARTRVTIEFAFRTDRASFSFRQQYRSFFAKVPAAYLGIKPSDFNLSIWYILSHKA